MIDEITDEEIDELSRLIFDRLVGKGAGIGNMSIGIIHRTIADYREVAEARNSVYCYCPYCATPINSSGELGDHVQVCPKSPGVAPAPEKESGE